MSSNMNVQCTECDAIISFKRKTHLDAHLETQIHKMQGGGALGGVKR